jgi:hypothetical protein
MKEALSTMQHKDVLSQPTVGASKRDANLAKNGKKW